MLCRTFMPRRVRSSKNDDPFHPLKWSLTPQHVCYCPHVCYRKMPDSITRENTENRGIPDGIISVRSVRQPIRNPAHVCMYSFLKESKLYLQNQSTHIQSIWSRPDARPLSSACHSPFHVICIRYNPNFIPNKLHLMF